MKKNVLTKISKAVAVLSVCSALFTIVLPFGTDKFNDKSYVGYKSVVSTMCDDEPEIMNHK